jgi:hypothetical protein
MTAIVGPASSTANEVLTINYVLDGGDAAIPTGVAGDLTIDFACVLDTWSLLADEPGSISVDIWKAAYTSFPPTDADSMCPGHEPSITAGSKAQGTVADWAVNYLAPGDVLRFNVDACTGIWRATLSLKALRT